MHAQNVCLCAESKCERTHTNATALHNLYMIFCITLANALFLHTRFKPNHSVHFSFDGAMRALFLLLRKCLFSFLIRMIFIYYSVYIWICINWTTRTKKQFYIAMASSVYNVRCACSHDNIDLMKLERKKHTHTHHSKELIFSHSSCSHV